MLKPKKLSDKPVRKGDLYCSPSCGGKCTWAEYQRAQRRSRTLAASLRKRYGGKWDPRVWENLGWHYAVVSHQGVITVSPYLTGEKIVGYSALIGQKWSSIAATPKTAIREALKAAMEDVKKINAVLLSAMQDTGQITPHTISISKGALIK